MECGEQSNGAGAQETRRGNLGGEEGFWNPGGRRRGGRGELQGPCNHCFAEGAFVQDFHSVPFVDFGVCFLGLRPVELTMLHAT